MSSADFPIEAAQRISAEVRRFLFPSTLSTGWFSCRLAGSDEVGEREQLCSTRDVKRHGFRRAWYIIRTGAENPDWEKLGGNYFLASWEKRGPKNSAVKEEAKASNVSE
jgi:hypothetical protein